MPGAGFSRLLKNAPKLGAPARAWFACWGGTSEALWNVCGIISLRKCLYA